MIFFTDKKYYVKGTCEAIAVDKASNDVIYYSNKFTTGNITTSVTMGEIRAGLGNAVASIIPSDASLNVEFTAADFSLAAKAAQVGASVTFGAPVMTCQTLTATDAALTIDVSDGAPVAALGQSEVVAYVQEVGAGALIATTGVAYPISAEGVVSDFTATVGTTYKVWYYSQIPTAQMATVSSLFDPKVVHFTAQIAVYSNEAGGPQNEGTRVGWLYVIVPNLKLGGNGGIVGDQTTADTTSISGQAIVYDAETVGENCNACSGGGSALAYYVFVLDNGAEAIQGLAVVGGAVNVATSSTAQIPVMFVMQNGQLVKPAAYGTGWTFTATGAPNGTTVSNAGVVTAGATTGDFEVTATYTDGTNTFNLPVNVSVVSA